MNFKNKVVIVTGGSSGIGATTAKLFAKYGALVVLVGRNVQRLDTVAQDCCSANGVQPLRIALDLTQEGSCQSVVKKTLERHKKIHVLVNCAGKASVASLFENTMEAFDELVALNLRVTYQLTQLCVPHLVKTKGNIVNIFSAPLRVRPGMLPHSMIRDALERFTKTGALELASEGVRMNAVRPGLTRTHFLSNFNVSEDCMNIAYQTVAEEMMPSKKAIEPEEVARMIVFVASDTCPNLNGASIILDDSASQY